MRLIWWLILGFVIGLLADLVPAFAYVCESYEDCLKKSEYKKLGPTSSIDCSTGRCWGFAGYKETGEIGYKLEESFKAILFKLDEISKKLDKSEPVTALYTVTTISMATGSYIYKCGKRVGFGDRKGTSSCSTKDKACMESLYHSHNKGECL